MTNYFYLVSVEIGNVADNIVVATFSNQVVSMDFSAGIIIRVNGTPVEILSAIRMDGEKIIRYKINVSVASTDNVKLSYTALPAMGLDRSSRYGDYTTSDRGTVLLETFVNKVVTNNVISDDPIGDALRADVIAYYKGANLTDSSGNGNTLTNVNSVTFTAGKVGNAFTFNGTNQKLTAVSNAGLKVASGQSFTWVLWVKLNNKDASQGFIAKLDQDDTGEADYCIYYNHTTDFFEFLTATDSQAYTVSAEVLGSPSISTWYMLVCQYDHADLVDGQKISVNNGAFHVNSHGNLTGTDFDLWIGNDGYYSGALNGQVDEAGFWKRLLTSEELAYLFNSGNGRTLYP